MSWLKLSSNFTLTQDVQWNDIDYAIGRKDFTTDLQKFGDQAAMVEELHGRGIHYVIITVSNTLMFLSFRTDWSEQTE